MRTNRLRHIAASAALATGALLAVVVPTATAATGAPMASSPTQDLRPRLERACLRIPNIEIRTQNLITRLQADETVRGSLAWLQVQIDRAHAGNRTQLATVLENRLAVRTQTLVVLEQRLDGLPRLKEICADHGVEV